MIKEAIEKVIKREDLTQKEIEGAFEEIMTGKATPIQIGAFITALRMKGETVVEITGAAKVMRSKALKVDLGKDETVVDTCGTGGSGINTFNISTASAFVVAGCGIKVAKHGNRSASSRVGSADVLEELGVNLNMDPKKVADCIKAVGIGFLYAPLFHSAMKYAGPPRREIGIRTIFNILGPLANPASATYQVLGVYTPQLTEIMAEALKNLGLRRAFVVCGEDSFDEITLSGKTRVSEVNKAKLKTYYVTAKDFGLKPAKLKDIKGGDVKENAGTILSVLKGEEGPGRGFVLANASAAIVAAGGAGNFKEGVKLAAESIDSGGALDKLKQLVEFTKR